MKNASIFIVFAFIFSSCNTTPITKVTATSVYSIVPTISPSSAKLVTLTSSPPPMPTLTHLPTQVLGDIIEIGDKNAGVNQYGWYVDGFNYNISSESDCVHSGQYGLEIKPETVDTRGSFWGIHYSPPLTKIKYINFWVKGKKGGETVFVWVTTDYGAESGFYSDKYVEISASEWRFVKITLSNYSEGTFSFFSFILEQGTGTDSVCIDDVSFTP